jgi:hypothetical protein
VIEFVVAGAGPWVAAVCDLIKRNIDGEIVSREAAERRRTEAFRDAVARGDVGRIEDIRFVSSPLLAVAPEKKAHRVAQWKRERNPYGGRR